MKKNIRNEAFGCISLIFYRVILDWLYFNFINPVYAYTGFANNRSLWTTILSWALFIVFYFIIRSLLYSEQNGVSHVIITMIYLLSFIPFTVCVHAGITPSAFVVCNSIYWVVLLLASRFALYLPQRRLSKLTIDSFVIDDRTVVAIGTISLFVVIYISGKYAHFRLNFNLFAVYDLRLEAREFGMSTLASYLFSWTNAINTLMLAYCLIKKKRLMTVVFFSIQMLSFGIDGSKTTFFLPFLVIIAVKFYGRKTVGTLKLWLLYGATAGSLASAAEYVFLHTFNLATLFIRRVLFVPNILNVYYFDYFTTHEPDYFRGSFLRLFGALSPYAEYGGISRMIGWVYFGSSVMNCNNGLLSDALSNLGFVGLIVMPLVIVISLHMLDRSTFGLDKRLVLVSGFFIALNLISTSFMTTLITHGFLLIIIMTWIMRPENLDSSRNPRG